MGPLGENYQGTRPALVGATGMKSWSVMSLWRECWTEQHGELQGLRSCPEVHSDGRRSGQRGWICASE
jgi:hypothetical protein